MAAAKKPTLDPADPIPADPNAGQTHAGVAGHAHKGKPSLEDRVEAIEAHLGLADTNKDPVTAEAQAEADAKANGKTEA